MINLFKRIYNSYNQNKERKRFVQVGMIQSQTNIYWDDYEYSKGYYDIVTHYYNLYENLRGDRKVIINNAPSTDGNLKRAYKHQMYQRYIYPWSMKYIDLDGVPLITEIMNGKKMFVSMK